MPRPSFLHALHEDDRCPSRFASAFCSGGQEPRERPGSVTRQRLSIHSEDGAPVPVDWPTRVGSDPTPGVQRREAYPAGKLDRDADFGTGPDAVKLAKALAWIKPSRRAAAGGRIFRT